MVKWHLAIMDCMQGHQWVCFDLVELVGQVACGGKRRRRRSKKLGQPFFYTTLGHEMAASTVHQTFSNFVGSKNSTRGRR